MQAEEASMGSALNPAAYHITLQLLVDGDMLPAAVQLCHAGHYLHILTNIVLPTPQVSAA